MGRFKLVTGEEKFHKLSWAAKPVYLRSAVACHEARQFKYV